MAKPVNPFDELERLMERMQENFDQAARWWETEPMPELSGTRSVQVDLEDRENELVLTADLPGFETEDVDVSVTDRTLRLEAEHAEEAEETAGEYVRRERRRMSVSRSVTLPDAVDPEEIAASYKNGVLTVTMPKQEPRAEATRIEIE